MKKLLLLFLAMVGMVSTASAKKLYVHIADDAVNWFNLDAKTFAHMWGSSEANVEMSKEYRYGRLWFYCELNGNTNIHIIRRDPTNSSGNPYDGEWNRVEFTGLSTTEDNYKEITTSTFTGGDTSRRLASSWENMTFQQNIIDWKGDNGTTWGAHDNNYTSHPDGDTFTFELSKTQINNSTNKNEGIRFRLRNGDKVIANDAGTIINGYPNIYPSSDGTPLNITGNTTTYYHDVNESTTHYWQIDIPSYDYEKIVITAKYVNESGYKWKISADAYISKTANGTNAGASLGYSTFGAETNVDLSSLPAGVTAQTASVDGSGHIEYNTATELVAGEGVLLTNATGADVALSIPVKASASAVATNALRRVSSASFEQSDETYRHYILTKNTVSDNDAELGWYLINDNGSNNLTVGTAYLQVLKTSPARGFFPLWSEDYTSVQTINSERATDGQAYNMAGQRIAQPTRGLYIVNGKKVVLK